MAEATAVTPVPIAGEHPPQKRRTIRLRKWVVIGLPLLFLCYLGAIAFNWPFTRDALIASLRERSLRQVKLGSFSRTYFPPGCVAENIQLLHSETEKDKPVISAQKLVLVTSYWYVLALREHLSLARVTGMHVMVPPSPYGKPRPVMPLTYSPSASGIKIDKVIADGTTLDFQQNGDQKPYRVIIDKLRLDGVGNNEPVGYKVLISTALPPGKVRSSGVFGVWDPKQPGSTTLRGNYTFDNANLAAYKVVSGTLFSQGSFDGTLEQLRIRGTVRVPNFKVADTSHDRQLLAAYRAVFDSTEGNLWFNQISARFDRTSLETKGSFINKAVSADLWTKQGRVEDILRLFISSKTSPMAGAFTFAGHVDIPPGTDSWIQRMKMTGKFGVGHGAFANRETERDLTRLSDSAEKRHKDEPMSADQSDVLSDLTGEGATADGIAHLSNVSMTVPGVTAWMHGTYGLIDYKIDLHGTLETTGSPGDAATGVKSFFVKLITPFFRRKHTEKIVPFKISGSYGKMNASLDLGHGQSAK